MLEQAKKMIRAGAAELATMESVKALIQEDGYEAVVKCLKAYEEQQKDKAN